MTTYDFDTWLEPPDDPRDDPELTAWVIQQVIDALHARAATGYDPQVLEAFELICEKEPVDAWLEWVEEQKV